jgi:hypothetical protein
MTIAIITKRHIPEFAVANKRLGRHVNHDSRSLAYQVRPSGTVVSKTWKRDTPILDQGNLGSCTGNAATGVLGSDPFYATLPGKTLDEAEAVSLYSAATKLDSYSGTYPPTDTGSDGLSVAKAAKNAGLISGYLHMTSVAACQTAIQAGPFIIGSDWYTGMDNPSSTGLVTATGTVRGGHEYECIGYDAAADMWELVNSWGPGFGIDGHFFYSSATLAKLLAAQGDATSFVPITAPAPTPTPSADPNVVAFHDAVSGWANARHVGANKAAAAAARALFAAEGLST